MPEVLDLLVYALLVAAILYITYRLLRKADIQEKLSEAALVEKEFQTVSKFEEDHKDISQKVTKVNEFKNKNL